MNSRRTSSLRAVAKRLILAALTLILSGAAGCRDTEPTLVPSPTVSLEPGHYAGKNIVIVSIDTLRADHLGLYGYARDTSPRLDAIAKNAITFDRARVPRGLTWPSLVSMFTSLYPKSSNVRRNGDLLADDVPTLASLLEAAGYATAGFLGNACGVFTRNFKPSFCGTDEEVHRQALNWIDQHDGSPFLLWVHYKAPHEEYLPPKEFDRFTKPDYAGAATGKRDYLDRVMLDKKAPEAEDLEHVVDLYDGEVLYSDALFGEVWDHLAARGWLDDTIVVFTSDHGEELLQHNNYYYHSCSIYDAVLHIPLVVHLPGSNHGGSRIPQLVENIDIAPTLLDLVGVARPEGFEGQSMRDLVNGDAEAMASFDRATAEYFRLDKGWLGSIRTDRWHYIYNPDRITPVCRPESDYFKVAEEELYDHEKDPSEQLNVAVERPSLIVELRQELLTRFERQLEHEPPQRADPRVIEQLKAMGYLVE